MTVLHHLDKHEVLRSYARRFPHLRTFIETGTADGSTTAALVSEFDRVFTIELDHAVYLHNVRRFAQDHRVTCLHGDSTTVLKELLLGLNGEPAMYWLDAHFSGGARGRVDTPIEAELREVFWRGGPKVVLIDDARLFGTDPAYPTVEWVETLVAKSPGSWSFELRDDIMRIVPADPIRGGTGRELRP